MTRYVRRTLARLEPGDEIFERRGRRVGERIGIVKSVEKNVPGRYVTVSLDPTGGFAQNWAASVLVKEES